MTPFLLGLATIPAIALVWYVIKGVIEWWPERPPLVIHESDFRVNNAAAILTARKVASVRIPGGVFLVYRSLTPWGGVVTKVRAALAREMKP